MQIVRELGGYTFGRSDLVRRAMSKKKASVMNKERQNFVYGNPDEGVPGCAAAGISEDVANKIFDEMTDFARYAFNKSHAACYAVVAYQTAWLKYYYPVEFMAALMTSVIDAPGKVAEYIQTCRKMKIKVLPPDINQGVGEFSVKDGAIIYGLSAIKHIGWPVIDTIVSEREAGGPFLNIRNFADRVSGREVNKRAVENLIKAGAMDCLGATRKQLMLVADQVMDAAAKARKNAVTGQMSLFDLMDPQDRSDFDISLPDVGEFEYEQMLAYEKEVLGVYVSGHPLEAYTELMEKNCNAVTSDFVPDEEMGGVMKVQEGQVVMMGGLVEAKNIKYTKKNQAMAFFNLEDLVGQVEVVVFPRPYERYSGLIENDARVFVQGHVQAEDDKQGKLICDRMWSFDEAVREVWLAFETVEEYTDRAAVIGSMIQESDGKDEMVIYVRSPRSVKKLGPSRSFELDKDMLRSFAALVGKENVKVVYRPLVKS